MGNHESYEVCCLYFPVVLLFEIVSRQNLSSGGEGIIKMLAHFHCFRYGRDTESENIFVSFERHIAEIAAFQLDRYVS